MSHKSFSLDELARRLGRDRREVEKLVARGQVPGRKVAGEWQFHPTEVRHWLEEQMRDFSESELAAVEELQQSKETARGVPVSSLLRPETVEVPLQARTKRSVLESLVEAAGRSWQVWEPATVLGAVLEREEAYPTAFENGVAIPHPRNPLPDALGESLIAFGRTLNGIPFGAEKGGLTDLYFLVLCRTARTHLQVLARLGRMIQLPDFLEELRRAESADAAYEVICRVDQEMGGE